MPRHAKTKSREIYRSPKATQAHRAGAVTHVIDLDRSPSFEVRRRANDTLIRHALALSVVGAAFWIYDIGLLIHH